MMGLPASAHQRIGAGWTVGSVHLRVAVHAASALPHVDDVFAAGKTVHLGQGLPRSGWRIDTALAAHGTHVPGHMGGVALLAQHGRTRFEHARNRAAVRVVARAAVFGNRFMLLHKRTALFGMAGVAGVIDAVALDQFGADRPVHVVAIGACHLAFRNGVVRWFVNLGALFLVALVAHVSLRPPVEGFVFVGMHLMAGIAGHTRVLVGRAGPQGALVVFVMAILARPVSVVSGDRADLAKRLAEGDLGLGLGVDLGGVVGMGFALSMATDAIGRAFVGDKSVRGPAVVRQVIRVVTGHAKGCPGGLGLGLCGGPSRAQPTRYQQTSDGDYTLDSHPNSFITDPDLRLGVSDIALQPDWRHVVAI